MYSHFARQHLEARLFQRFNASRRDGGGEFEELERSPRAQHQRDGEEEELIEEYALEPATADKIQDEEKPGDMTSSPLLSSSKSISEDEDERRRYSRSELDTHTPKHNRHHLTIPHRDTPTHPSPPPFSSNAKQDHTPSAHLETQSRDTVIDLSDFDFKIQQDRPHKKTQPLTRFELAVRVLSALFWGFTAWRAYLLIRMVVGVFVYR